MRDCVFLLADSHMEKAFKGFFSREKFHRALGTGFFDFDPLQDIILGHNDPAVWKEAHQLLRGSDKTHRYAVVVLDEAFEGTPKANVLRKDIEANMCRAGWMKERFAVIVIKPELEAWIWQENTQHIEKSFGFKGSNSLRVWLQDKQVWPSDCNKPPDPKRAFEETLRFTRQKNHGLLIQKICASPMSVKKCQDASFLLLRESLQRWFPPEAS